MRELKRRKHKLKREIRLWRQRLVIYKGYNNPEKYQHALTTIASLKEEVRAIEIQLEQTNGD